MEPAGTAFVRSQGFTVKNLAERTGKCEKTLRRDLGLLRQIGFELVQTFQAHGRKVWRISHPFEAATESHERYGMICDGLRGLRAQVEAFGEERLAARLAAIERRVAKRCDEGRATVQ